MNKEFTYYNLSNEFTYCHKHVDGVYVQALASSCSHLHKRIMPVNKYLILCTYLMKNVKHHQ